MNRLAEAVRQGIITQSQRDQIEALDVGVLPDAPEAEFRFSLVHLLWVAGVALVVVALVVLAAEIAQDAQTLLVVALVYAAGLMAIDQVIKNRVGLRLLSSCLYVGLAACGVVAIAAWQNLAGFDPYIHAYSSIEDGSLTRETSRFTRFVLYSLATQALVPLAIGLWLLRARRFLPAWILVFGGAYVIAMEAVSHLTEPASSAPDWEQWITLLFGLAAYLLGWRADLVSRHNHGFWLNKLAFAFLATWLFWRYYEGDETLVFMLSVGVIFMSVFLRRPFGVPVGAFFIIWYLADLFDWWEEPLVVAAFLAVIGAALIFWGVRARLIENRLEALLPDALRQLRPARRDDPVTFGL